VVLSKAGARQQNARQSGDWCSRREKLVYGEMRVAHIREQKDSKYLEVMFLESARIYKLFKENPAYKEILGHLRTAKEKKSVVRVLMDVPEGDVIKDVEASG
jgi:hypothetical protein